MGGGEADRPGDWAAASVAGSVSVGTVPEPLADGKSAEPSSSCTSVSVGVVLRLDSSCRDGGKEADERNASSSIKDPQRVWNSSSVRSGRDMWEIWWIMGRLERFVEAGCSELLEKKVHFASQFICHSLSASRETNETNKQTTRSSDKRDCERKGVCTHRGGKIRSYPDNSSPNRMSLRLFMVELLSPAFLKEEATLLTVFPYLFCPAMRQTFSTRSL